MGEASGYRPATLLVHPPRSPGRRSRSQTECRPARGNKPTGITPDQSDWSAAAHDSQRACVPFQPDVHRPRRGTQCDGPSLGPDTLRESLSLRECRRCYRLPPRPNLAAGLGRYDELSLPPGIPALFRRVERGACVPGGSGGASKSSSPHPIIGQAHRLPVTTPSGGIRQQKRMTDIKMSTAPANMGAKIGQS
jgi:hypothetical protein